MTLAATPSKLRRADIEAKAGQILAEHGLTSIPIDPITLANRHGIKVHNAKFSQPNISGLIAKRGTSSALLVEGNDSPVRKRFTIAHELGHYFLHLSGGGEFVDTEVDLHRRSSEETDSEHHDRYRMEVEANQFAAALLMPDDLVRKFHQHTPNVRRLAKTFRVSEEAMAIRLGTLGLD